MNYQIEKSIRIGVDVGGTFTDFFLVDTERHITLTGKRLTTPRDPSQAIIEGLDRILSEAGRSMADVRDIVHGTTLVTNTVIERKGARVGLVTTKGFRDTHETGTEMRYDLYDLFFEKPEPIVPRRLRMEIDERIAADGSVLRPLDLSAVEKVAEHFTAEKVDAIAICLMHSYLNPAHEQALAQAFERLLPEVPVTQSCIVAPEIREFERGNTACVNAYVQPLMNRYLTRLESQLRDRGLAGPLHVMLSNGGIATVRAAREQPVHLIESGPAAGATAACHVSRQTGQDRMISFDMGGTTAKMALIEDHHPERSNTFEAARVRRFKKGSGLPLKVPVIDLIEIGAGGGSIAWLDKMGLLKVGPESAGSEPGPICYGRGGRKPTVTDADLLLGYLSPDYFLGGEMKLDLSRVADIVNETIAAPLGITVEKAAAGIHEIVNHNMATATRMYISEKGRDPRNFVMTAFGGAGPVHAFGLARALKLRRVIVPRGAGVMSAYGFLAAHPSASLVRSKVYRLEALDWDTIAGLLEDMIAEATGLLTEAGADPNSVRIERSADMRFVGQGFEIPVPLERALDAGNIKSVLADAFIRHYEKMFGRRILDVPIEVLSWRVHAVAPSANVDLAFNTLASAGSGLVPQPKAHRLVYFPNHGFLETPVYERDAVPCGTSLKGPVVIEERESTSVAGPASTATIDAHGNIVIDLH